MSDGGDPTYGGDKVLMEDDPEGRRTEVNVIRIPSEDGAEYDLYLVPPESMTPEDAVKVADEAVASYFESMGELELFPHLIDKGFGFLNIYTTEGTW